MPKYLYVYHGGSTPQSKEEGEKVMKAWMDWFGGLGKSVVEGGNPVGMSKTVGANGVKNDGGANPASGWSVIEATDFDDATNKAKGCPLLSDSGSVEVAEIMEM